MVTQKTGRPKRELTCSGCGGTFGAREMRTHVVVCGVGGERIQVHKNPEIPPNEILEAPSKGLSRHRGKLKMGYERKAADGGEPFDWEA